MLFPPWAAPPPDRAGGGVTGGVAGSNSRNGPDLAISVRAQVGIRTGKLSDKSPVMHSVGICFATAER